MRGVFQLGRSFFAPILICISCNGWAYGGLMVGLWWTYVRIPYFHYYDNWELAYALKTYIKNASNYII